MPPPTLNRPAPRGLIYPRDGGCHPRIGDWWTTPDMYGRAVHICCRHCPLAVKAECERRLYDGGDPPRVSCVQAGVQVTGRRLEGVRLLPVVAVRQPAEEPCRACEGRRRLYRLCTECAAPLPLDSHPARVVCDQACLDVRSRRLERYRDHAETPAEEAA